METKKILVTGGTGFIGQYLVSELMQQGHYVTIITRSPERYTEEEAENQKFIGWEGDLASSMAQTDVVINLAGENLFGQRWTQNVKEKLYKSRIDTTRKLVEAIRDASSRPKLMISASGINYYADNGDRFIDESGKPGDDFLANICRDWEKEALKAENLNVRTAIPRIAPVLFEGGGMIDKMKLPFAFFAGGPLGSGKQYLSWIHMIDMCRAILFPIENSSVKGAYNACSPNPVTMNDFAASMGKVMNRPSFFKVPEFALNLILGEASGPVLSSLRIQPKALQQADFDFDFEDLEEALADIL